LALNLTLGTAPVAPSEKNHEQIREEDEEEKEAEKDIGHCKACIIAAHRATAPTAAHIPETIAAAQAHRAAKLRRFSIVPLHQSQNCETSSELLLSSILNTRRNPAVGVKAAAGLPLPRRIQGQALRSLFVLVRDFFKQLFAHVIGMPPRARQARGNSSNQYQKEVRPIDRGTPKTLNDNGAGFVEASAA
jgi:hypothetical protein